MPRFSLRDTGGDAGRERLPAELRARRGKNDGRTVCECPKKEKKRTAPLKNREIQQES